MSDIVEKIQPALPGNGGNDLNGVAALHARLRRMILKGEYPPGATLSQVELANSLGVSRTPLREALRMLQKEGLVEAEHNQRTRIPAFDPQMLDAIYASRILFETLGIRLTVPGLRQHDLDVLRGALAELSVLSDPDDREEPHRRFHRILVSYAGEYLRETIANYADRCEYYRRMYIQSDPGTRAVAHAEHEAILQACLERDSDAAAYRLSRHLARTALTLLTHMTPEYEPAAVRTALQIAHAGTGMSDVAAASPRRRTRHENRENLDRGGYET